MNIFRAIIDWAREDLPPWEQEAVRLLIEDGEIAAEDEQKLFERLKSTDTQEIEPVEIPDPQPATAQAVSLVSLEHVCGVNALAPGQKLTFKGLTVIYGGNGSGKTGYSRVLKHACRSREKKPPVILGDAFCSTPPPAAQAKFTYAENGIEVTEDWTVGVQTSEALGSIALFDSSCSRSYVEEDGDPAYRPYGLEVFEQLGAVCKTFKARLGAEADAIKIPSVVSQFSEPTIVAAIGSVLADNSATNIAAVSALATLSDAETAKAEELQTQIAQLKTNSPQKLADACRRLAARLENSVLAITAATKTAQEHLALAPGALAKRDATAKLAAEASAIAFGEEPVHGVGTDEWKSLFEYAKAFSIEVAYPGEDFPYLGNDANCVLCHQPLSPEAKTRMRSFADFIDDQAAQDARSAEADYQKVRTAVIDASKKVASFEDSLVDQVEPHGTASAEELRASKSSFASLQVSAERASTGDQWKKLSTPKVSTAELAKLAAKLRLDAAEFEKNSNADELKKLEQSLGLLRERQQLKKASVGVTEAASKAKEQRRLRALADGINVRRITLKNGEITKQVLTNELCAALNTELKRLGAKDMEVEFAPRGGDGSQPHYLRFKHAPKGDLKKVLSEGEHRALGLAAFLAELRQGGHTSAIILDDPVSSLDHLHRDAVARRLVEESKDRQVIIFTHDLAFLAALWDVAGELQVPLTRESVAKTQKGAGVPVVGMYPESMTIPELIAHLRTRAATIAGMDINDPERRPAVEACYGLLRTGWERVVEEVLLNKVVSPFSAAVKTLSLKGVQVEPEDYGTVFWAMRRVSNTIDAHRIPAGSGTPRAIPNEEIAGEVEALEAFRKATKKRSGARTEELTALEQPPKPV